MSPARSATADRSPAGRRLSQPGPRQHRVEQMRLDRDVGHGPERGRIRPAGRLEHEEHDAIGHETLERLRLLGVDRRHEVAEGDHLEAPRKLGSDEAHQNPAVTIDANPGRVSLREGGGEPQPQRRNAALAEPDEERHSPDDAVRVGRSQRVPDDLGVLREPRKRRSERSRCRQIPRGLRECWPRWVRGDQERPGAGRPARVGGPAGQLERDREHDVAGHAERLAQERIARRAAATGRARLPERGVDRDDRGAGPRQARDQPGVHGTVPRALAELGLARRVANDDEQRRAPRQRTPRAQPPIVGRPLERGDPGASECQDTGRHQSCDGAHHRSQRHGSHGGCGPRDGPAT